MSQQSIPCPVCRTPILFDVRLLLSGDKFCCTNCGATISLSQSSVDTVGDAMRKLDRLRDENKNVTGISQK